MMRGLRHGGRSHLTRGSILLYIGYAKKTVLSVDWSFFLSAIEEQERHWRQSSAGQAERNSYCNRHFDE